MTPPAFAGFVCRASFSAFERTRGDYVKDFAMFLFLTIVLPGLQRPICDPARG